MRGLSELEYLKNRANKCRELCKIQEADIVQLTKDSLDNGTHKIFDRLRNSAFGNICVTVNDKEINTCEWKYIQEWFLENETFCSIGKNYMNIDLVKKNWRKSDEKSEFGIILLG